MVDNLVGVYSQASRRIQDASYIGPRRPFFSVHRYSTCMLSLIIHRKLLTTPTSRPFCAQKDSPAARGDCRRTYSYVQGIRIRHTRYLMSGQPPRRGSNAVNHRWAHRCGGEVRVHIRALTLVLGAGRQISRTEEGDQLVRSPRIMVHT